MEEEDSPVGEEAAFQEEEEADSQAVEDLYKVILTEDHQETDS